MAAVDLIRLIDLSLGEQPCGVVNFNYLQNLLHEIVRRLLTIEETQGLTVVSLPSLQPVESAKLAPGSTAMIPEHGPSEISLPPGGPTTSGGGDSIESSPVHKDDKPHPSGTTTDLTGRPSGAATDLTGHPSGTATDLTGRAPSTTGVPRPSSRIRSHVSVVSAANDLSALERKLQELENRMNSFDTLPELLERKASDVNATPVRDMWNFTNLNNRVSSAEEGLDKTSQLVDDVLGEIQSLKQQLGYMGDDMSQRLDNLSDKFSANSENMEDKLKQLEALKLAASSDSPSDAFMTLVTDLQQKLDSLQKDSQSLQERVNSLENSLVDSSQLQDSLKEHIEKTNTTLQEMQQETSQSVNVLGERIDKTATEVEKLTSEINQLESALQQKVNASDLASLMPSGDGSETAGLMTKLLELQNKMNVLEGELDKQPSDLLEKITAMQNAIDHLSSEISRIASMVSSGADSSRVEELGSQLAQLRERLGELDRAMSALTNAVSSQGKSDAVPDEDNTGQYVDLQTVADLQQMVGDLQQEQERLIGTAAHLSHEIEVNKEHVKTLYSTVDDLRATKADKEQVAIEVEEKADRAALEGKASRDWVDSTFERLDREIREAKSHLLGQEEAFRSAVSQINEDVDGKLDRMELEPLKNYFDKRIDRIKTTPVLMQTEETLVDDAAGFRKPLRFRCISCDKPVGIKPNDAVPALPQIDMLPGTRSFRPYTTYELELIRRHQKMGQAAQSGMVALHPYPQTLRSAGGIHTLTRPHQRVRMTPFSSVYTLESSIPVPPPNPVKQSPNIHDEMDIVGQDGHIYKGRVIRSNLPPIIKAKSAGRSRTSRFPHRPSSTTPVQTVHS